MAPIPEDNQEQPPPGDDQISAFSNGNLASVTFGSDSSDDNDENDNHPDSAGYMLLPQDPTGDDDNDSDNEIIENNLDSLASSHDVQAEGDEYSASEIIDNRDSVTSSDINPDEGTAAAPTVRASGSSYHPEFIAKFPHGNIPSYMQLPDIPSNSNDMLWNKKRPDKSASLDTEDNKILKAMSGFSIPSENVPEWAKNLSEDQWNNVVSKQIRPTQLKSSVSSQNTSDSSSKQKQGDCDWVAEFPDS